MKTSVSKIFLSAVATAIAVGSIVYAASYVSGIDPNNDFGSGTVMGKDWYQQVNDKIASMQPASKAGWRVVGMTGTAPSSGYIVAISCDNCGILGQVNGVDRGRISKRDKYGVGFVTLTMPIAKGESWSFVSSPSGNNEYTYSYPETVQFFGY